MAALVVLGLRFTEDVAALHVFCDWINDDDIAVDFRLESQDAGDGLNRRWVVEDGVVVFATMVLADKYTRGAAWEFITSRSSEREGIAVSIAAVNEGEDLFGGVFGGLWGLFADVEIGINATSLGAMDEPFTPDSGLSDVSDEAFTHDHNTVMVVVDPVAHRGDVPLDVLAKSARSRLQLNREGLVFVAVCVEHAHKGWLHRVIKEVVP